MIGNFPKFTEPESRLKVKREQSNPGRRDAVNISHVSTILFQSTSSPLISLSSPPFILLHHGSTTIVAGLL